MDSDTKPIAGIRKLHADEELQIDVLYCPSDAIIINFPGLSEGIDGFDGEYPGLAQFIVQEKLGAVIRVPGKTRTEESGEDYSRNLRLRVKSAIEYAIDNAPGICGQERPRIRLMGYSAGASGAAAVAHLFPFVDRVLLRAPSGDVGPHFMFEGFAKFTGEVYIISGEQDRLGRMGGEFLYHKAIRAKKRTFVVVPSCDHWFKGAKNKEILKRAAAWAFGGDTAFPSTAEGTVFISSEH